ncbi:MAG: hypothetical protein JXA52_06645 [Planctomycetes bacterium]|nr:hypothetical protein [Planctomycetota bacterium]
MRFKNLFLALSILAIFLLPPQGFCAEAETEAGDAGVAPADNAATDDEQLVPEEDDFETMTDLLQENGLGEGETGEGAEGESAELPEGEEQTAPEEQLSETELMMRALAQSRAGADQEEFYHGCEYVTSQTLMAVLTEFISPKGTIAESAEADMVVISEIPENIEKIKRIIQEVDRPTPQVLVRAHIVELNKDYQFEKELSHLFEALGGSNNTFLEQSTINLAAPETFSGEFYSRYGGIFNIRPLIQNYGGDRTNQLNSVLRYLEGEGVAKVLASTNLIMRRNVQGELHVGDQVPYEVTFLDADNNRIVSTEYKNVGVYLVVVPIRIFGDTVRLYLKPEVSTLVDISDNGQPLFNVRTATTQLDVKDGELLSIGGLYRNEEIESQRKVPILGDVPFLKHFFTSTTKNRTESQLVFLFTTQILRPSKVNDVNIYPPDEVPESLQEEISRQEEAMNMTFTMEKDKKKPRPSYAMAESGHGLSIHHPRAIPDMITDAGVEAPDLKIENNKSPLHTYEPGTTEMAEPEDLLDYVDTELLEETQEEITLPLPELTPEAEEIELLPEDAPAPETDPEPVPEAEVILTPERPLSLLRKPANRELPAQEPIVIDLVSDLEQQEFAEEGNKHFYADLPEVFQ